jgi:hypothetical protein
MVVNAAGTAPVSVFDTPLETAAWKQVEGEFVSVMALNSGWQSLDAFFGPYADISDGAIDLTWILAGKGVKSSKILPLMLDTTKPPVTRPFFAYTKVTALTVEAYGAKGIFDVDGEVIPTKPVQIEVHHGLGNIIAPVALSLPEWPAAELPAAGLNTTAATPLVVGGGAPAAAGGGGDGAGGGGGLPPGVRILQQNNV